MVDQDAVIGNTVAMAKRIGEALSREIGDEATGQSLAALAMFCGLLIKSVGLDRRATEKFIELVREAASL